MEQFVYCLSYDLRMPNRNYSELYEAIKSFQAWWHQTESVWFIVTNKDAGDVRDFLIQFVDNNDKLFVIQVIKNWGGKGFSKEEYDWLRGVLK
ncbi:MAG: hypothetical protein IJM66_10720 [Muribaculaceae bacterium]|nr:hypothetical protein [Muribaculaceae bacterium]